MSKCCVMRVMKSEALLGKESALDSFDRTEGALVIELIRAVETIRFCTLSSITVEYSWSHLRPLLVPCLVISMLLWRFSLLEGEFAGEIPRATGLDDFLSSRVRCGPT